MAFGRTRNNKRSTSSNSYVSTITTIVFIALCVLGVWMLTSDSSVVAPQGTTRASTTFSRDESNELNKPNDSNKPNEQVNSGTFEDNPGDLPDDALKNGDSQKSSEDKRKSDQVGNKDYSAESNVGGSYQQNVEKDQNLVQPKADDNDKKEKENEPQFDENVINLDVKESAEEHEKQHERQAQVSEENLLTEKQNIQQDFTNDQESNKLKQQDQVEETREGDQRQTDASGQSSEEATQKYDNQKQHALEDQQQEREQEQDKKANNQQIAEQQQKDTNQQQIVEEQQQKDTNQQQTVEEQQQQQGEKPITFSDETKKDPSKQDSSEEVNTNQQDKSMGQQAEDEVAKRVETGQENDGSSQANKQDTAGSTNEKSTEPNSLLNSGIPKESNESKSAWSTQAAHSNDEKQRRKEIVKGKDDESLYGYTWKLCNVTSGHDYIPCLDNEKAIKTLRSTKHFQHRERHCPEDPPTCLVPAPQGYKKPFQICSSVKRP